MGIQSPCDFTGVVTAGNEQITFTDESPCRVIREDQNSPIQVNLQGTGHATLRVRLKVDPSLVWSKMKSIVACLSLESGQLPMANLFLMAPSGWVI